MDKGKLLGVASMILGIASLFVNGAKQQEDMKTLQNNVESYVDNRVLESVRAELDRRQGS